MTTTTATAQQTEAEIIEDLLQRIEHQMELLEQTESLAKARGALARAYDAREAITCLQWACAYINHGRFEDAEQALKAAKVRIREVYA